MGRHSLGQRFLFLLFPGLFVMMCMGFQSGVKILEIFTGFILSVLLGLGLVIINIVLVFCWRIVKFFIYFLIAFL